MGVGSLQLILRLSEEAEVGIEKGSEREGGRVSEIRTGIEIWTPDFGVQSETGVQITDPVQGLENVTELVHYQGSVFVILPAFQKSPDRPLDQALN